MFRLVESGLKFCKQRLKYGRHNSFFTSRFEMAENRVQVYKTTPSSSLWVFVHVYKASHCKMVFNQRYYVSKFEMSENKVEMYKTKY